MTKITIELSEEDYHLLQSDETQNDILEKMCELYEAEQRKIGFGEWALHNESGDITLIKEGDNLSVVNSNFTKLSLEAQDILNKETGMGKYSFKVSEGPGSFQEQEKQIDVNFNLDCPKCGKKHIGFYGCDGIKDVTYKTPKGGRVMTNKEKSEKIQKMFLENYDSIRKTIGGDSYTDIRDAHKLHLECVLKVLFPEDEEDRK